MTSAHLVRRAGEAAFVVPPPLVGRSEGFRRWPILDESTSAVHTGFGIVEVEPGGWLGAHVHAYEETLFVLDGQLTLRTSERAFLLRAGDYGLIPIAVPHALRNDGTTVTRLAAMSSPQPRARFAGDTYFVADLPPAEPITVDVRDPRMRRFGHIEPSNMDVEKQTQDMLEVSASMRTALLAYSGITVKMMIDSDLGADLTTMFMVQYEPDGLAGPHDHPFEETYLILDGEVDATFDDQPYHLVPGDVAFAGVGCVHGFTNASGAAVRWLETQAPQPPGRHSYRFARDWTYLRDALGEPT